MLGYLVVLALVYHREFVKRQIGRFEQARSAQVVAFLAHHGHHPVYNLAGGIDAWSTEVDPAVPRY